MSRDALSRARGLPRAQAEAVLRAAAGGDPDRLRALLEALEALDAEGADAAAVPGVGGEPVDTMAPGGAAPPDATIGAPLPRRAPSALPNGGSRIPSGAAAIGTSIGPYRILSILGEGGFGVVYLAERREPHIQRVALKLIKPGMDSTAVINRFSAERQALAVMDHPAIAKVFDGGSTEDGRPYFVMEFVRGEPITEFCDRERLGIDERLRLFITVCEAVQHAHGKGVIHRDLKPSNVLVEFEDGRPAPKVIDFGVAKALNQRLVEATIYTEVGQFIGTPEYMSPEQAEMSGVDIDTRADVYSLGVMLYELATGRLPFESVELRQGGFAGIQRTIREVDPPRPSQRFTTIVHRTAEEARTLAKARRVDPPTLSRRLRGDLDWVIMRCLEKDRTRRYQTALDLAVELRRVLDDEPVEAGPPSVRYRLGKFVRRHRAAVGAAAVGVLALIAATVVSLLFAVGEARAKQAAEQARELAQIAREVAEAERDRAIAAERRAETEARTSERVATLTREILGGVDPVVAGALDKTLIRRLLDSAAAKVDRELAEEPQVAAELFVTIGATFLSLGEYDKAERPLDRALELRRETLGPGDRLTLRSADEVARLERRTGRLEAALERQRAILAARLESMGEEDPDTISSLGNTALVLQELTRLDEASALFEKALEAARRHHGDRHATTFTAMNNLATLRRRQGDAAAAESLWREALAGQRDLLGPEHLGTIATKSNLAGFLSASRDPVQLDEAEMLFTRVVEVRRAVEGPGHPETLRALSGLGSVAFRRARFEVAETHFAEAFAGLSELLGPEHGSVVSVGGNLLAARRRLGRAAEAESGLVEWIEAIEARVGPGGAPEARSIEIWSQLALQQEQRGDHGAAASTLADAVRHARRRVVRAGDSEAIVARLMLRRGEALGRLGEYRSGGDLLEEAHDILERELGRIHADVQAAALRLAEFHERWATTHPEVPGTLEKARRWRERGEAP